jgi:hypothetical protein
MYQLQDPQRPDAKSDHASHTLMRSSRANRLELMQTPPFAAANGYFKAVSGPVPALAPFKSSIAEKL